MSSSITFNVNKEGAVDISLSFDDDVGIDMFTKLILFILRYHGVDNGKMLNDLTVKSLMNHVLTGQNVGEVNHILTEIGAHTAKKNQEPLVKPRNVFRRYME